MSQPRPPRDRRPVEEVIETEGVAEAIDLKYVASVLYTYRCSIACRHCLFNCHPRRPDVHVGLSDGIEYLRQLHTTDRAVHVAGGEPMLYWDDLIALCRAAGREGVAPHFIETNAYWCCDDEVTRGRMEALRKAGVTGIFISTDPFHMASISPAYRRRSYRIAVEIFGRRNVAAGDASEQALEEMRELGRDPDALAEYVRKWTPQLVGRAGDELAPRLDQRPVEELAAGDGCAADFDPQTIWEIHLDPYGNIQTNCGIIVGDVRRTPLPELITKGFAAGNKLVSLVSERGPFGLLELAEGKGYRRRGGYADKCHLCWEVRKFLRPFYPRTLGPAEIYERPAAGAAARDA